ncbi:MAG TPA: hypothetical protein VFJ10_01015 [Acidobacteriaceae bacterium]|nr:hypothetical protein [Acidobacteriaceae bacterium]
MSSAHSRFAPRLALAAAALLLSCSPSLFGQASASSMPLDSGFGPLQQVQPSVPVEQIIKEFTAKESLFNAALNNYTWTRAVKVQTLDEDGHPNGQYYQVVDIYYSPTGQRKERVTEAPESTLKDIMMSEKDYSDIEERLPFVLTTEDAPQYDFTYLGQEKVDDIDTWVFDVKPKAIQKNKRYFQGRIWVDQKEHQIVVTNGKNVPDDLRPGHEDLTLPFITYRQMVDGKYWFPVYTVGEAVLHFQGGHGYLSQNAHMREVVKYSNYRQYRTDVRVIFNGQDITHNGDASQQQPNQAPAAQQPNAPATAPKSPPQH